MDTTSVLFAVASLTAFMLAFYTPFDERLSWETGVISAGVLITYWAINNFIYMILPLWVSVITDSVFFTFYSVFSLWVWWWNGRQRWYLLIISSLMGETIMFDGLYLNETLSYETMSWWENLFYLLMLLASAATGLQAAYQEGVRWISAGINAGLHFFEVRTG